MALDQFVLSELPSTPADRLPLLPRTRRHVSKRTAGLMVAKRQEEARASPK
jgi:hypothetical protein